MCECLCDKKKLKIQSRNTENAYKTLAYAYTMHMYVYQQPTLNAKQMNKTVNEDSATHIKQ